MIELATPWLLCALPLPGLLRRFLKPAPVRQHAALKVPFYARITALQTQQQGQHLTLLKNYKYYLSYLVWALLVLAASGPQWVGGAAAVAAEWPQYYVGGGFVGQYAIARLCAGWQAG